MIFKKYNETNYIFIDKNNYVNKKHYYESELFSRILNFVQSNPKWGRLKQTNQSLAIVVFEVNTIKQGMHHLERMLSWGAEANS